MSGERAMTSIKKLATAAAFALCTLLPTAAIAENMFLSTKESEEKYIMQNIWYDFEKAGNGTFTYKPGALNDGDFTLPDEGIIVVVARTKAISNPALKKLQDGMKNKPGLKFIIIAESGGSVPTAKSFDSFIADDIISWPEAHITHLSSSNYAAIPLDTNSAWDFSGINAGLNSDPFSNEDHVGYYIDDKGNVVPGDENEVHVHTYGVMECIPDKDRIFSYSPTRCQRTRGNTTTTDDKYFKARTCYATGSTNNIKFKVDNLMEDITEGSFLSATLGNTGSLPTDNCARSNPVSCEKFTASTIKDALDNAQKKNNAYKNDVAKLNEHNASFSFGIPQWQSNKGKGACILFIDDGNLFDAQGQNLRCDNGDGSCTVPTQDDHAADIFSHVNQRQNIARMYLAAANSDLCNKDLKIEHMRVECPNVANDGTCTLKRISTYTDITVDTPDLSSGEAGQSCNTPGIWCDGDESKKENGSWVHHRPKDKDIPTYPAFCGKGENSVDYCCTECTDAIKDETGYCLYEYNEKEEQHCCKTCDTTVSNRTNTCDKGQKPGEVTREVCCKCDPATNPDNVLDTNGFCCPENDIGLDPVDRTKRLCCGKDNKDSTTNVCCGGDTPQATPTAAGGRMCCKDGQVDDGTGKCAYPCTGGKGYKDGKCECPSGKVDDGTGNCATPCTGGKEYKDGKCECPSGKVDDGTGNCANPCTGGKEYQDGKCECPTGKVDDGTGNCIASTCPTGLNQYVCDGQTPEKVTCCGSKPDECTKDSHNLNVCSEGQTTCCKLPDKTEDNKCSPEQFEEYCCDVARSDCCKPCDEKKKENTICKGDEHPGLRCCTCPENYNERPICEKGQKPWDKTFSKAWEKDETLGTCCRPAPSSSAPVPVNNPWALGLLGAAVAAFAARRRRQNKQRDDA